MSQLRRDTLNRDRVALVDHLEVPTRGIVAVRTGGHEGLCAGAGPAAEVSAGSRIGRRLCRHGRFHRVGPGR
jgi:hypothetical protein